MKLHTLVLEGDHKSEKNKSYFPVFTKKDYLRRKWIERRPSLHSRSFYLCRMIEEELKGTDIDGSGKITICAHQTRYVSGNEKYIHFQDSHVSIYYLEPEEIIAIEEANENIEASVMWEILRNALLDIARRNHRPTEITEKIEKAFEHILNSNFVREERIDKLTRRANHTGLTAHVYRVLSAETGEGWYLKIADRKGNIYCQETIDSETRYVNRLGSRLYAKAEWRESTFVILERFGKDVFSINADPYL